MFMMVGGVIDQTTLIVGRDGNFAIQGAVVVDLYEDRHIPGSGHVCRGV